MKILQVVHTFPPKSMAGTELCTFHLSKELIGRGHDLAVFTASQTNDGPRYEIFRYTYDGLAVAMLRNWFEGETDKLSTYIDFDVERSFRNYVEEFRPDLVHIQHLQCLSTSIIEALFEKAIPIVLTAHDYWYVCPRIQLLDYAGNLCSGPLRGHKCAPCVAHSIKNGGKDLPAGGVPVPVQESKGLSLKRLLPRRFKHRLKTAFIPEIEEIAELRTEIGFLRKIERSYLSAPHFVERCNFMFLMLSRANLIITPSEYTKKKYAGFGLPEDRIKAVYHGMNTRAFSNTEKRASDAVRFAYFGGLMRHKGIEILLKAFAHIPRSHASLHIYGDEEDPVYKGHLMRLVGDANVVFHGRYDNAKMPDILSEADVVVVPSLWEETFNLVVREGFMTHTPVIASRIGALGEAVRDGVDGFLVEPGNINELRQKIQILISDPELLPRLRRGIKPVKDLSQHASEIEEIYRNIVFTHHQVKRDADNIR